MAVAQNGGTRLDGAYTPDPTTTDVSSLGLCKLYLKAGAPIDLDALDKRLGSEAIIHVSGLDVVRAPSTTADPKAMPSRVNKHTYDSVSNGAHKCAGNGVGAICGGVKSSIFFATGAVDLWMRTRIVIASAKESL